jgi:hypothetical protein
VASLADLVRLPPLALLRALDDLHTLAQVGAELMKRLDELEDRAEAVQAGLDDALAVGHSIDDMGRRALELLERLDARGASIVELGARLQEQGVEIQEQGVLIEQRAQEVASRGAELVATLPTLEAAVALVAPLEGAVERLGRMVDRLPGGARRGGTAD